MYSRTGIFLVLTIVSLPGAGLLGPHRALAQEGAGGSGGSPLVIHGAIPSSVAAAPTQRSLHFHLEGAFPDASYHYVSRIAVWAAGPDHSCRLGWRDEVIDALIAASGQLWLATDDLIDRADNRSHHGCGTIDGIWGDRLEISVADPRLIGPGTLRVGVAWYPEVGKNGEGVIEQRGRPVETWVEIPIRVPLEIVGRTPRTVVVTGRDDLRVNFAFTGSAPTSAALVDGSRTVPLTMTVRGSRVEVVVPATLVEAPTLLTLRLGNTEAEARVPLPVCAATGSAVVCPS